MKEKNVTLTLANAISTTRYVGTKTSFRFINNNWSRVYTRRQPRDCSEDALMLFGNGAVRFLHALAAKFGPGGNKQVYFMAPEFALNARGTYKKAYAVMDESGYMRVKGRNSPPTGIEGVFFGLEVCDTVDLFGFQIANDPKIKYVRLFRKIRSKFGQKKLLPASPRSEVVK